MESLNSKQLATTDRTVTKSTLDLRLHAPLILLQIWHLTVMACHYNTVKQLLMQSIAAAHEYATASISALLQQLAYKAD